MVTLGLAPPAQAWPCWTFYVCGALLQDVMRQAKVRLYVHLYGDHEPCRLRAPLPLAVFWLELQGGGQPKLHYLQSCNTCGSQTCRALMPIPEQAWDSCALQLGQLQAGWKQAVHTFPDVE